MGQKEITLCGSSGWSRRRATTRGYGHLSILAVNVMCGERLYAQIADDYRRWLRNNPGLVNRTL